jgi:predicted metal-binding protein
VKIDKIKSSIEVYVCNHHRDGEDNCHDKGAKDLTRELKDWAKKEHHKEMKIYRSGCLGKCSDGIAIACYPQKKMLLEVDKNDLKEIKQGLERALLELKG